MSPSRLTCEETFRRLNDYLDRVLTEDEVRLVEQHLETCAQCTSEYKFETSFVEEMRNKLSRIAVPQEFREQLLAKLTQAGRANSS